MLAMRRVPFGILSLHFLQAERALGLTSRTNVVGMVMTINTIQIKGEERQICMGSGGYDLVR